MYGKYPNRAVEVSVSAGPSDYTEGILSNRPPPSPLPLLRSRSASLVFPLYRTHKWLPKPYQSSTVHERPSRDKHKDKHKDEKRSKKSDKGDDGPGSSSKDRSKSSMLSSSSSPAAANSAHDRGGASFAAKTSGKVITSTTSTPATTTPRDSEDRPEQGGRGGNGGGDSGDSAAGEAKGLSSLLGAYGSDSESDGST